MCLINNGTPIFCLCIFVNKLYILFLLHFYTERRFLGIQKILDAYLPFCIALHIIFAPCSPKVIAVLLLVLQAALQAESMTDSTIVLLVEELVISVVDTFWKEHTHEYLRVVYLDVISRVGIAYVIIGEGL